MILSNFLNFILKKKTCKHAILLNSIPKSGTNLLLNIIKKIPNVKYKDDISDAALIIDENERFEFVKSKLVDFSAGSLYVGHIPYTKRIADWLIANNVKIIFLYRDPRAVTVSLGHYIMRDSVPRHKFFSLYNSFANDHERLKATITGFGDGAFSYFVSANSIPSIKSVYDSFKEWLEIPLVLSVKFEDFVSADKKLAIGRVVKIMDFLQIDSSNEKVEKIFFAGSNPMISRTFRKGEPDAWRSEYSEEHIMLFKQRAGDILSIFGYEE